MLLYILLIILTIASIIGLTQLASSLERRMLYGKQRPDVFWILPLRGQIADLELLVSGCIAEAKESPCCTEIILLDMGMEEETRKVAGCLCERFPGLQIQTAADFSDFLETGAA
ncbi:MAG TPA: hypothetical protein H9671_04910 [Firmicutes bacterium]|nr:hypothetical protein [Bacillota bacterium]